MALQEFTPTLFSCINCFLKYRQRDIGSVDVTANLSVLRQGVRKVQRISLLLAHSDRLLQN